MKAKLIVLFLFLFYCCNTKTKETTIIDNGYTFKKLNGKVKKYSYDFFYVKSYNFGEPQFVLDYSAKFVFNSFGFEKKSNISYINFKSEISTEYSDSINGIRSKRTHKGSYSDYDEVFYYDSISKKLSSSKERYSKDTITRTFEYEKGIQRTYHYNKFNELYELSVKKFDNKGRVLEEIDYNKDGFELDEMYTFYFNDGSKKDSVVERFTSERKIYRIITTFFDNTDRIIKETTYFDGKLDDVEGYYIEYDDSNYNSSYNLFNFKRNSEVVLEKFRVTKKLDNMGNVSEEVKLNLSNNKIVNKRVSSYEYYLD